MSINAKGQRKQRGAEDLTAENAEGAEEKGGKGAEDLTAEGAAQSTGLEGAEVKGGKGEGEQGASTGSATEATEALVDGQWKVGSWNGMEMHTCVHCQWDTLEGIWAAREHKAKCQRCAPPPPARATSELVLVADRWGNPIAPPLSEG